METSEYRQCLKSMFELSRFGIRLGLSTIKYILNELGNPENYFHSIHVAGTNGKGSVASSLAKILEKSGYSVGLYTSPHLINFNERICINGHPIDDHAVIEAWKRIKSIKTINRKITFFEFSTAMALYHFREKNIDFAVIETGMGGKHDATNIISPILSIITNISIEHKEYLGNTIKQISEEKAGIIKPRVPIVSGVSQKNAITVISEISKKMNSEFLLKKRDFKIRKNRNKTFEYFGKYNTWHEMHTSLKGSHQIENASLTLAACELLNRSHTNLSSTSIRSGLFENKWPGRLEVILDSPYVILDGAHNLMAAKNLSNFMKKNMAKKKITLVVGILDDKPYKRMIKDLSTHCSSIIVTRPKLDRALPLNELEKTAKLFNSNVKAITDVGDASIEAIKNSGPDDAVCIAGSLYVVGEAKMKLESHYNLY